MERGTLQGKPTRHPSPPLTPPTHRAGRRPWGWPGSLSHTDEGLPIRRLAWRGRIRPRLPVHFPRCRFSNPGLGEKAHTGGHTPPSPSLLPPPLLPARPLGRVKRDPSLGAAPLRPLVAPTVHGLSARRDCPGTTRPARPLTLAPGPSGVYGHRRVAPGCPPRGAAFADDVGVDVDAVALEQLLGGGRGGKGVTSLFVSAEACGTGHGRVPGVRTTRCEPCARAARGTTLSC